MSEKKLSHVEKIKTSSDGLRGTLKQSLTNEITGSLRDDDQSLIKFHGLYQQDDRDRREERSAKKLEWLYSFMIRLRLPGGFLTPEQWIGLHHIAGEHSTGIIKITTRQTVQLHGIVKSHIKPTIQAFDTFKLDSIAACGDVNRNVLCSPNPTQSTLHQEIYAYADEISQLLLPKTRSYYDIWLDEEKLAEHSEEDPLYQDRYLPRKFKIAIAIPPNNDTDVFANDIGLIAIIENNQLKGFNIAVGGGLSATHGNPATYARAATVIGFAGTKEKVLKVVYEIVTIQRDFGNRSDRKLARLKYTLDNMGVEAFKTELNKRIGYTLKEEQPYVFTERKDYYGWVKDDSGLNHYTVFVENGRVLNDEQVALKSALLELAETGKGNFKFTANQNVIISDIKDEDKVSIDTILQKYHLIEHTNKASGLRKNSMACVALPTCPLALAEAQRYLPNLIDKIEPLLAKHNLQDEQIVTRMTGCPNGCGRSAISEIGFIGTAAGKYNLQLGGDHEGYRLNKTYKGHLDEEALLLELDEVFASYRKERNSNEKFGDYTRRKYLL